MIRVCHDADVTYEWDEQASKEASGYPVSEADADALRRQWPVKTAGLGADGVRGHAVSFPVAAWDGQTACRTESPDRPRLPG